MFTFDLSSTLILLLVIIGLIILAGATGEALSFVHPIAFLGVLALVGLALWYSITAYSSLLSRVTIIGYFFYLLQLLGPTGLLLNQSATLTAAVGLLFVIEFALISAYFPARFRRGRNEKGSQRKTLPAA